MIEDWLKRSGIVLQPLGEAHLRALAHRNHPLAQAALLACKARHSQYPDEQTRLYKQADAVDIYMEDVFEVLCLFQLKAEDANKWRSKMRSTIRKEAEDLMAKTPPVSMGMLGNYMGWKILTVFEPLSKQS
jgi:hypothetical protein